MIMKIAERFRAGSLTTDDDITGGYFGLHFWGLDWIIMVSHPLKDHDQITFFRFHLLDRGLFSTHGQIIILEISIWGFSISFRYLIPEHGTKR